MNRFYYLILAAMSLTMMGCGQKDNPLLGDFQTPFQTPPFDQIETTHFLPAAKEAISLGLAEVEAIVNNPEPADFANTIDALAWSGSLYSRISRIFYNLNSAETNAALQEVARELSPLASDYSNDILFNKALFERVKTVYEQTDRSLLSTEQITLLENTYKQFVRNGALLDEAGQNRLRDISRELSDYSLRFQQNVLAETNAWVLHITDESQLAGLPGFVRSAAAELAASKEQEGWMISLQAPSYGPFMQYADDRELRREVYMAFSKRAQQGNDNDNREALRSIANLRLERANLLGYDTHADFVLEERMAESPQKVYDLLGQLLDAARPTAMTELDEVNKLAMRLDGIQEVMPWDWSYYSEKLRKEKYDFDQELLRPYFELSNAKKGVFTLTEKLWGLSYVPNKQIPVYHPDVEAYEVYDANGSFLAVLYMDFFPREGKSPGAWMTSYQPQHRINGVDVRPHISIVCNFTKPTSDTPSLLSFYEFRTFLHEFGHALHGMFSDVTYPGLAGTAVFRDFVELPSMIMENWAMERDFLDIFAVHYESGERIPQEYIEKIIEVRNFNAGYTILRQLGFGFLDMAWHSITEIVTEEVEPFELRAMEPARLLPRVEGTAMSPVFAHIFSGGYAAGYYSYKWSEVLDADAFQVFAERGIFDRPTANAFRLHILSRGGTEHPMKLYTRFRGQQPSVEALLRRDGLI